MGVGAGL